VASVNFVPDVAEINIGLERTERGSSLHARGVERTSTGTGERMVVRRLSIARANAPMFAMESGLGQNGYSIQVGMSECGIQNIRKRMAEGLANMCLLLRVCLGVC